MISRFEAVETEFSPQTVATELVGWLSLQSFLFLTENSIEANRKDLEVRVRSAVMSFPPEDIAVALKEIIGKPVQHGEDHFHWVIWQGGPERHSPLSCVSEIPVHSDQNAKAHNHKNEDTGEKWIEAIIPLGHGLVVKFPSTGETYELPALRAISIPAGVDHATYNQGDQPVTYLILRRKLVSNRFNPFTSNGQNGHHA